MWWEAAPEEVEQRGLIPPQTWDDRLALLNTPAGGIDYIGAIMQAMAMGAAAAGYDISRRIDVLCFAYHARGVEEWEKDMLEKRQRGESTWDISNSEMAVWVGVPAKLTFIELSLGTAPSVDPQPDPTLELSAQPRVAIVYFDTDDSNLNGEGEVVIEGLVQSLMGMPDGTVVSIAGHADARGDSRDNLRLSESRALAVFTALEAGLGGEASRLTFSSVGRGETQPAADLTKSRRVTIEID